MQVSFSEQSWHYRLQKFVFKNPSKMSNLCPYFWKTVWGCLMLPLALIGSQAPSAIRYEWVNESNTDLGIKSILVLFVSIMTAFIVGTVLWFAFMALLTPTGAVFGAIGVGFFLLMILGYQTSGLWIPFLFAIKNKVCPIISWEEE